MPPQSPLVERFQSRTALRLAREEESARRRREGRQEQAAREAEGALPNTSEDETTNEEVAPAQSEPLSVEEAEQPQPDPAIRPEPEPTAIADLQAQLDEEREAREQLEAHLLQAEREVERSQREGSELRARFTGAAEASPGEIESLRRQVANLTQFLKDRNDDIDELQREIHEKNIRIRTLEQHLAAARQESTLRETRTIEQDGASRRTSFGNGRSRPHLERKPNEQGRREVKVVHRSRKMSVTNRGLETVLN